MTIESFELNRARHANVQETLLQMYPALLAFFRRRLPARRREEASDLTQETLLAAWAALTRGKADGVQSLVHYVLGIARHKCNDSLRAGQRERSMRAEEEGEQGFTARVEEAIAERRLLEAEWRVRWSRAFRKLRPLEREILRLRFLEQLSNEETCKCLKIPPEEGSRLKYRALERLRFLLRVKKRGRS